MRALRPGDVMDTMPPSARGALPACTAGEPLRCSSEQPDPSAFSKATASRAAKGK